MAEEDDQDFIGYAGRDGGKAMMADMEQEKQWKQLGNDPTALRLQVKFVRHHAFRVFLGALLHQTMPPRIHSPPAGPLAGAGQCGERVARA